MKGHFIFAVIAVIAIMVAAGLFWSGLGKITANPEKYCADDADCMPDSCCHAKDTVNKNYFPDCAGMICTAECVPNTLDCSQGEIKCVRHECTIAWNNEQIAKYA